jgi:hypothetical protein
MIIVSRHDPSRHATLKRLFADRQKVDVLFNRRTNERRQLDLPVTADRRRQDRRRAEATETFQLLGFAVIRDLDVPPPRRE